MRKAFVLLLLGALAAGLYFLTPWWDWLNPPYPEKLFPQDTVVYVYLHNVEEAKKAVQDTLLWKQMDHSSQLNPKRQLDRLFVLVENSTGIDARPLLAQMTREAALGIYSLPAGNRGGAVSAYVKDEKETRTLIEQQVDSAFRRRVPDLKKTEAEYHGVTYYKYSSDRFPSRFSPCWFLGDHHLVFAVSEPSLQTLIDVQEGKAAPIKNSQDFKDAKESVDYRRGVLAYVNLKKALAMLQESLPPTMSRFWPGVTKITGVNSLQSFSYKALVDDEGFSETAFISVREDPAGLLKIYLLQPPKEMEILDTIPSEATVVTAGTLADFAKMWDEINSQIHDVLTPGQAERWEQGQEFINGVLNFNLREDLLEALGDQFSLAYEPAPDAGANPHKTMALLALKLKKPDRFADTVERLAGLAAATQGFKKREETYKSKKIFILQASDDERELLPSYYFRDSWFYFSTHLDLLKKSIDTDRGTSIISRKDFRRVSSGFPSSVNGLSYTEVSSVLRTFASAMNPQDPEMEKDLEQVTSGLFGGASYLKIQKGGIYFHSYSSVPSTFLLLLPVLGTSYSKSVQAVNLP